VVRIVRVMPRDVREATLSLPPSVNHQYARYGGRVRLTDAAKSWRETVQWTVQKRLLPAGPIAVSVAVQGARHDIDNVVKALLDALQGIWWQDDSAVAWLLVRRLSGEPCLIVRAWSIPGEATTTPRVRKSPRSKSRWREWLIK
jgi:Holliday junction resolvase RusA-like endonuclease